MTYFIQIHDRADIIDDNDVDRFDSLAEARAEALRVVSELVHEGAWGADDHGWCFVRILDDHRQVVCTVDLWEAVLTSAFIKH